MKKYLKLSAAAFLFFSVFFSCKAELNNIGDPYSSSYKKDKNSLLLNVSLSKGNLTPAFDTNVEEYTAGVANGITDITITPTAASVYAGIKVNDIDVTSAEASAALDLSLGNNTITIVVTAEDSAYSTIYTIELYRAVALPRTGQTSCYYDSGSSTYLEDETCSETYTSGSVTHPVGQDGQLQKGAEWPEPRFENNPDGATVTDKLTGLIWIYAANTFPDAAHGAPYTWDEALTNCNNLHDDDSFLNDSSVTGDWHLPNINEIRSLFHYGVYLTSIWLATDPNRFNSTGGIFHSSTTIYKSKSYAFRISMEYGQIFYNSEKSSTSSFAWAVKAGSPGLSSLIKTGQTKCYDSSGSQIMDCEGTGQDGEYQAGIEPPEPRFINNGDGTITDRLTGLMWEISPRVQVRTWDEALSYANNLTLADHYDWRLPNINELSSIQNAGVYDVVTWLLGEGFVELEAERYFSSTTYSYEPDRAWTIDFLNSPATEPYFKTEKCYAIAVRGAD